MLLMIRNHLHFEMGQLQGLIQTIAAAGNLAEEQEGLCHEVVTRLEYLRQMIEDKEPHDV